MGDILLGIVSCSDSCYAGESEDRFGRKAAEIAADRGFEVVAYHVCPDDIECIEASIVEMCDIDEARFVLTIGGTGLGLDEVTPEGTLAAAARVVPGIIEAMRAAVASKDATAMLSRAVSVQRGKTIIVNIPACEGPFETCLDWVLERAGSFVEAMDLDDGR